MDISGSNRYEILFMDDESILSPEQAESVAKKKLSSASAIVKTPNSTFVKKNFNVEKENKSGALNKNGIKKSVAIQRKLKTVPPGGILNTNRLNGEPLSVAIKSSTNEGGEQRTIRRNFREGGEFASDHREPRQFKERDNRVPQRNREGGLRVGKREFDRQSGSDKTGVKAIDKREGAGAHNWGSVKQEIDDINKSTTDADAILTDKEESSNEQSEQPAPAEEEVKELTLDEWKAIRGQRTKPQYNIRKPNEGEDTSQWKKMVVLNKKKEGDSEEEYEYDPSMYPQRVGRLQRIVNIQFNFNDGRRGGTGFGRGRGRGTRPSDDKGLRTDGDEQQRPQRTFGDRQQKRSTPNALKVDDERQFPTLS